MCSDLPGVREKACLFSNKSSENARAWVLYKKNVQICAQICLESEPTNVYFQIKLQKMHVLRCFKKYIQICVQICLESETSNVCFQMKPQQMLLLRCLEKKRFKFVFRFAWNQRRPMFIFKLNFRKCTCLVAKKKSSNLCSDLPGIRND